MSPSANTRVEWARRLAHSIVSDGYATDAEVAPVLNEATDRGSSFPALLISRDVTSQEVVLGLLSQLTRLPVVDLDHDRPSDQALASTPVTVAREYGAVGYRLDGDQLTTAFGDPPDEDDVRALSVLVGHVVVPVLANPIAIERVLASIEPAQPAPAPPPPPAANGSPAAAGPGIGNGNGSAHVTGSSGRSGVLHASPNSGETRGAAPRRPPALRGERRRLGPPPHHGSAGLHPAARRHPAHRGMSGARQRDDPGHGLRDPPPDHAGDASRPRRSSTPPTPSWTWGGSGSTSSSSGEPWPAALRAIPHEIPPFEVLGIPESDPVVHRHAPRARARHRADRVGEVDHPGVARRHHQPDQAAAHRDGGGPHRVPPHPQAGDREPARGRTGHHVVLRGPAAGAA